MSISKIAHEIADDPALRASLIDSLMAIVEKEIDTRVELRDAADELAKKVAHMVALWKCYPEDELGLVPMEIIKAYEAYVEVRKK